MGSPGTELSEDALLKIYDKNETVLSYYVLIHFLILSHNNKASSLIRRLSISIENGRFGKHILQPKALAMNPLQRPELFCSPPFVSFSAKIVPFT